MLEARTWTLGAETFDRSPGGTAVGLVGAAVFIATVLILAQSSVRADAEARVGQVVFAFKEALVIDRKGERRWLEKGGVVHRGDTLATVEGRLQIRLDDGGTLSLDRMTRVRVTEYAPPGAAAKLSISLVDGSIRGQLGTIGRGVDELYRLESGQAAVGIRGAAYAARVYRETDSVVSDGGGAPAGFYVRTAPGTTVVTAGLDPFDCSARECLVQPIEGDVAGSVPRVAIVAVVTPDESASGVPPDRERASDRDLGSAGLLPPDEVEELVERWSSSSGAGGDARGAPAIVSDGVVAGTAGTSGLPQDSEGDTRVPLTGPLDTPVPVGAGRDLRAPVRAGPVGPTPSATRELPSTHLGPPGTPLSPPEKGSMLRAPTAGAPSP